MKVRRKLKPFVPFRDKEYRELKYGWRAWSIYQHRKTRTGVNALREDWPERILDAGYCLDAVEQVYTTTRTPPEQLQSIAPAADTECGCTYNPDNTRRCAHPGNCQNRSDPDVVPITSGWASAGDAGVDVNMRGFDQAFHNAVEQARLRIPPPITVPVGREGCPSCNELGGQLICTDGPNCNRLQDSAPATVSAYWPQVEAIPDHLVRWSGTSACPYCTPVGGGIYRCNEGSHCRSTRTATQALEDQRRAREREAMLCPACALTFREVTMTNGDRMRVPGPPECTGRPGCIRPRPPESFNSEGWVR